MAHPVPGPGRLAGFAALWLALAAPAGAQGPLPHSAKLELSSSHVGAQPVEVTVQLGYDMQCGYPGPGPVLLTFPAAEHVPATIPTGAVLVDGKMARAVHVAGQTVSVGLAPPPQVMCDVIGPGRLTLELKRAAGLGNPGRAGSYLLRAAKGGLTFTARFAVRAG